MPDYRRLYLEGGLYFFTANLQDRSSALLTRRIEDLRAAYARMQRELPVETIAICILPDHLHCVWRLPERDHDFSTRWKVFKAQFTRRLSKRDGLPERDRKGERGVWQRRFWEHAIRNDEDLRRHIDYTHFNPVKHGHVADPDHWPHSSWQRWKSAFGKAWSRDYDPALLAAGERS
jgi:putative transposase